MGVLRIDFFLNSFLNLNIFKGDIHILKVVHIFLRNSQSVTKKIPFITASKGIKYLGMNLTKEVTFTLKTRKHCQKK